ncbi:MAG: helix-turn-helix domain-containing protein [Pseudonocardiaceae bacterium]
MAGMGKSTLHRIERGERELTLSEIIALSSALETDPSTLIRGGASACIPGRW